MRLKEGEKGFINYRNCDDEELICLACQGDLIAEECLINKYKKLVKIKARSYFLIGADTEDIIQEGMIGLYKAVRNYQFKKLSSFKAFAELCITRQIITAIKSATRQKHIPLNSYISLNRPIYNEDSDRTLLDIVDNLSINDPQDLFLNAEKWYLITSLDDYSRLILYACLVERETTWEHILALEAVLLKYGFPLAYYVDSHSIFRFVQGRDSYWRNHYQLTDEANPQWKQVLDDCRVKVTYALSPQAKGKVERPYRWIQDRLVRTCYRESIRDIKEAQLILNNLVQKYNYRIVHSSTGEIPYIKFQRAIREKRTLFREFTISPPFKSTKDIFCLRIDRMVNSYRKVSINNLELKVPKAPLHESIQLRITPDKESGLSEVRFWHKNELLGMQKVKNSELNLVQF